MIQGEMGGKQGVLREGVPDLLPICLTPEPERRDSTTIRPDKSCLGRGGQLSDKGRENAIN